MNKFCFKDLRKRLFYDGWTFGFVSDKRVYYIQFSFEKPWLIPKIDRNYLDGSMTLVGWLFLYFGWNNKTNAEIMRTVIF